jgi:hypothetical protein
LKPEPITEQARQLTYGKNFVSEIKGTVSAKWLSIGLIFLTIIIWIVFS